MTSDGPGKWCLPATCIMTNMAYATTTTVPEIVAGKLILSLASNDNCSAAASSLKTLLLLL